MDKNFNGLDRLGFFAQALIAEISSGHSERVDKIIEEMGRKNVVHYIFDRYKDNWLFSLGEQCPYNLNDWEEAFYQLSYITEGDARRKWGICNENDGLLLLVTLSLEALRDVAP